MSIETSADRLDLLKKLGEQATFYDAPDSWSVYGVLDREFVEVSGVESYRPVLTCRTDDTTEHPTYSVDHGTRVDVAGVSFEVAGIQPDGTGMVAFVLEESGG